MFFRDNEDGMTAERCAVVFDKHETDREKVGGLGLGLSIVKKSIESHGGTVKLDSQVGIGSTFKVRLPAASNWGAVIQYWPSLSHR